MKPTEEEFATYKDAARTWAQERLDDPNTVILDLESTGLLREDPDTEIAQICITDTQGRQLLSMLVKPNKPMGDRVIEIHKISNEQVFKQPTFYQIARMVAFVLKDKHVVAFNAEFDWQLLVHMFKKYKFEKPTVAGISCAMDRYSEWCGEWSDKKSGFRWQKLPNFTGDASHDAYNDCQNTLLAMRKMAGEFKDEDLTEDMIDLDF